MLAAPSKFQGQKEHLGHICVGLSLGHICVCACLPLGYIPGISRAPRGFSCSPRGPSRVLEGSSRLLECSSRLLEAPRGSSRFLEAPRGLLASTRLNSRLYPCVTSGNLFPGGGSEIGQVFPAMYPVPYTRGGVDMYNNHMLYANYDDNTW